VKLGTSRDDYAVLLSTDYVTHIRSTAAAMRLAPADEAVIGAYSSV
jgi:hypothetical protein